MLLREKEANLMGQTKGMDADRLTTIVTSTLVPIHDSLRTHAPYVCRQLKKRPFGNIRMFVAALQACVPAAAFAGITADLEKACGKDLWTKIAPFIA